ncbi:GNAT family N-acetyltransferase [uncultured Odoribacter sp.]|uniref:GNAT family N-acetyltransferase n=1 Tax=uncultured Odoribacter sp. TaxID=876416 RepID=UPI0026110AF9|nr:GNAT family N-acetyltransferase [uncultured Odoribacter sp.]
MQEKIIFRKAIETDTEEIGQIILDAKEQMRLRNSRQWQNGYPASEDIDRDIQSGYGYVLCEGNRVVAYGAVIFDGEPAYRLIQGKWHTEDPYVAVHRLAVSVKRVKCGLATRFMQEVEKLSCRKEIYSFRVDTNFDNLYMLRLLTTLGFNYCGEIRYDKEVRKAYDKNLR